MNVQAQGESPDGATSRYVKKQGEQGKTPARPVFCRFLEKCPNLRLNLSFFKSRITNLIDTFFLLVGERIQKPSSAPIPLPPFLQEREKMQIRACPPEKIRFRNPVLQRTEFQNYHDRAQRKPKRLFPRTGLCVRREAERTRSSLPVHAPPRSTRALPLDGPWGLEAGELA